MATLSIPRSSACSCWRKTPTESLSGFRVNWQRSRRDGRLTEITGSPFWYTTVTSGNHTTRCIRHTHSSNNNNDNNNNKGSHWRP